VVVTEEPALFHFAVAEREGKRTLSSSSTQKKLFDESFLFVVLTLSELHSPKESSREKVERERERLLRHLL